MEKKILRDEETAQGRRVQLIDTYFGYEVHLQDAGIFYFDELQEADHFVGLVAHSDFKPHGEKE